MESQGYSMGQSMSNANGNSRPELIEIIDSFKIQIDELENNCAIILEKVCLLREFRESTADLKDCIAPDSDGYIGDFQKLITRLQLLNMLVAKTKLGLTKFVG